MPIVGADSFGVIAFGADEYIDQSTLSAVLQAQLAGLEPFYVIRAYPFDPGFGAVEICASENGRMPDVALTDQGRAYPDVVVEIFNITVSISQEELTDQLSASPTRSSIRFDIRMNESDAETLERYDWNNRKLETWRGYPTVPESQWDIVRTEHMLRIRIDELGFWIDMRDPSLDHNVPLQVAKYAGTGVGDGAPLTSYEGGTNLKDKERPFCVGPNHNVSPVLIDEVYDVYQVNDRQVRSIDNLRDKGLDELHNGIVKANGGANDIVDMGLTHVWEWTPVPGTYITDLSQGLLRPGAKPAGTLTCDVQGYGPPIGSADLLYIQTVPHNDFDVLSYLEESTTGTGWKDSTVVAP